MSHLTSLELETLVELAAHHGCQFDIVGEKTELQTLRARIYSLRKSKSILPRHITDGMNELSTRINFNPAADQYDDPFILSLHNNQQETKHYERQYTLLRDYGEFQAFASEFESIGERYYGTPTNQQRTPISGRYRLDNSSCIFRLPAEVLSRIFHSVS